MLYYKCPTCKTVLANKQLLFEQGMEKISYNKSLPLEEANKQKCQLLDDLELKRECCRMRVMGYVDLIHTIK